MLDITKLARQIPGLSQHLIDETAANRQRLDRAQQIFNRAKAQQTELAKKQEAWRDRLLFNAGIPVEPLDNFVYLNPPPAIHTVIATDGSQIAPSHHEIAYCYLINVGRVMLHYGQSLHPLLDSIPEVFYRPEDLYISLQWGIRTEEWMGYCRTVSEAAVLAELACNWVNPNTEDQSFALNNPKSSSVAARSAIQNPKSPVPTLAMVDGPLIYWFLEGLPVEARDRILPPILEAWEQMRLAKVPLMGYLSAARSMESLSFLRLEVCTHPAPDCMTHCVNLDKAPCQVFEPLRDAILWASQLKPGQRSPLWRSVAKILDLYGNHQIYFCYVHVGTEIARIEVPAWVAEDSELFDQSLSLMLGQVQKGYGYPVTLAEAHNQAVIRGSDRTRFFALLEQQMIKAGLRNVGTSYKEARKRGSIA